MMQPSAATWHGTEAEAQSLALAVEANCSCGEQQTGQPDGNCAAHQVFGQQRVLDGLLFARRIARRLQAEEDSTSNLFAAAA